MTFGVSGRLWKDALVMYDHQSETLWGHVIGEAIHGDLKGARLTTYPANQTTWKAWKRRHPDTKVLKKPKLWQSSYARYNAEPWRIGIHGRRLKKNILTPKAKVAGFEIDGQKYALPLKSLQAGGIEVTIVGETAMIIVVDESGQGITIWRAIDRATLSRFDIATNSDAALTDQNGTTYSLLGSAPTIADGAFIRVQVVVAFWFGWYNFHPLTEVISL